MNRPTLRDIAIEDPIINLGDIEENLKHGFGSRSRTVIRIRSKNIRCTIRGKGLHVCKVW